MNQMSENELLQRIAETIEQGTGMVLEPEMVKVLLLEVQREQLKGLVYKAFLTVNQAHEQQESQIPGETTVPEAKELDSGVTAEEK